MDQTNVVPGPPILVIVQRRKVDNVNFDGQDDEEKGNRPTRVIRNVQELHRIGIDLGYTTKVVDLVDMTLREQVKMMQETDVFAAVFGTFIPLTLEKYNIDPALATGPFITTVNDVLGLFI
jgi:hypothetical protein